MMPYVPYANSCRLVFAYDFASKQLVQSRLDVISEAYFFLSLLVLLWIFHDALDFHSRFRFNDLLWNLMTLLLSCL